MRACAAFVLLLAGLASASEVTLAPDRMLEIGGKRTFVIGLYEYPQDDAILDAVAKAGFNLIHASANRTDLDRLYQRGLFAWINTGDAIDLGKDGSKSDAPLRDMAAAWGSHPALLVWEVPDEALWNCWLSAYAEPLPLLERVDVFQKRAAERCAGLVAGYKALKKLDSHHPVWMNHAALNSIEDLAAFNNAADIVGCDEYPVLPYPTPIVDVSRGLLNLVGTCTTRMQIAAPGKPVWMVLQGTGWTDFDGLFGPKDPSGQRPDFHESRFMAYDVIVRGARGILYWGTHYTPKDSQLWRDLLRVASELSALQPVLSAPDAAVVPTTKASAAILPVNEAVHALGKNVDGRIWWLVVNEYPIPVSCTLSGLDVLDGQSYTDSASGVQAVIQNGAMSLEIPAYGVLVLEPRASGSGPVARPES